MAEALYRKYRPRIFEDVVGQEHIERTIKNAIAQDKVSHAYLFCGPRGTGKTTTARLLAKALLCEKGPTAEPDGSCDDCEMIASGAHPDVYELDAASRTGVENVREEIIGRVQFAPTRGQYKVYIIDEVHMLSTAAFNALLKTLEEPPSHVVFILCTTDPQKVPETIHSRCQRFDFRRIGCEAIVSRLGAICMEEDVEFEGDALELIAQRAEGGMRNALTSLEQLIAFGEGKVTLADAERMLGALDTSDLAEIVRAIGQRDVAGAFRWTADYVETGADLAQFTRDLAEHMRNMYVLALSGGNAELAVDLSETVRREMAEELPLFGPDRLARMLGVLGDLSAELRVSTNPRLSFEIAMTRMVRPDSDLTLEALAERIERLEQGQPAQVAQPLAAVAQQTADIAVEGAAPEPASSAVTAPAVAATMATPVEEASRQPLEEAAPQRNASVPTVDQTAPVPNAAVPEEALRSAPHAEVEAAPEPVPVETAAVSAPENGGAAVQLSERIQHELQNPAALQRLWQAVLSHLKQEKAAYGVLFLNTKAVYDTAQQHLTIEFPAESDFAFGAASKPDVTEELACSIEKVCAASIPFSLAKGGKAASVAPSASTSSVPRENISRAAVQPAARPASAAVEQASAVPTVRHEEAAAPAEAAPARREPRPSAASQPQSAPADDPYYDEVPLDAYGDLSYGVVDASVAAAEPPSAAKPASEPVAPAPVEERASMPSSNVAIVDAATSPTPEEPSASELDAVLAYGFGEGLAFTEVEE